MAAATTKATTVPAAVPAPKKSKAGLTSVIPLGIALLHGAVTGTPPAAAPVAAPVAQPAARVSAVVTPGHVAGNTLAGLKCGGGTADSPACVAPVPMLSKGHPVEWWFVFKLNTKSFPSCGNGDTRTCLFGGPTPPPKYSQGFSQQFVYASAEAPALQDGGKECLGTSVDDPVGASFDEVYNGTYNYVVWNDQPYGDPALCGKSNSCSGPWGHSKGMLAWNDAGEGFVMQVSTPSWPLSGSHSHPRMTDGNTLGCMKDDDVEVSQHFFALHLTHEDLVLVLQGLGNASVVTNKDDPQVVHTGGPQDVTDLVAKLGTKSDSGTAVTGMLSSGVEFLSKPSNLAVPPWQFVSSELGGVSLHVANWYTQPDILPDTTAATEMGCWDANLQAPGAVVNAQSGTWNGTGFGLLGGSNPNGNHAKVGVSTSGTRGYAIFGDMNQEGSLTKGNCSVSQNGRGGTFYVLENADLAGSVGKLIGATP